MGGGRSSPYPAQPPTSRGPPRTALSPATPPAPRRRAPFLLPRPCPTPGWLGAHLDPHLPRYPPATLLPCGDPVSLWRPSGSVLVPDVPDDGLSAKLHPQWPRSGWRVGGEWGCLGGAGKGVPPHPSRSDPCGWGGAGGRVGVGVTHACSCCLPTHRAPTALPIDPKAPALFGHRWSSHCLAGPTLSP